MFYTLIILSIFVGFVIAEKNIKKLITGYDTPLISFTNFQDDKTCIKIRFFDKQYKFDIPKKYK